jgi:hypothetical protein
MNTTVRPEQHKIGSGERIGRVNVYNTPTNFSNAFLRSAIECVALITRATRGHIQVETSVAGILYGNHTKE